MPASRVVRANGAKFTCEIDKLTAQTQRDNKKYPGYISSQKIEIKWRYSRDFWMSRSHDRRQKVSLQCFRFDRPKPAPTAQQWINIIQITLIMHFNSSRGSSGNHSRRGGPLPTAGEKFKRRAHISSKRAAQSFVLMMKEWEGATFELRADALSHNQTLFHANHNDQRKYKEKTWPDMIQKYKKIKIN